MRRKDKNTNEIDFNGCAEAVLCEIAVINLRAIGNQWVPHPLRFIGTRVSGDSHQLRPSNGKAKRARRVSLMKPVNNAIGIHRRLGSGQTDAIDWRICAAAGGKIGAKSEGFTVTQLHNRVMARGEPAKDRASDVVVNFRETPLDEERQIGSRGHPYGWAIAREPPIKMHCICGSDATCYSVFRGRTQRWYAKSPSQHRFRFDCYR